MYSPTPRGKGKKGDTSIYADVLTVVRLGNSDTAVGES